MARPRSQFAPLVMLFIVGVGGLARYTGNLLQFSQNVRTVDIVGISGSGAALGAAIYGFIYALRSRKQD